MYQNLFNTMSSEIFQCNFLVQCLSTNSWYNLKFQLLLSISFFDSSLNLIIPFLHQISSNVKLLWTTVVYPVDHKVKCPRSETISMRGEWR